MLRSYIRLTASLVLILLAVSCSDDSKPRTYPKQTGLTVMVYSDGDNDLEGALLYDIYEMSRGIIDDNGVNVIVLIDRIPGYSTDSQVLGEDFTDTRLYRVVRGAVMRIPGGASFPEITETSNYEANMGDANTLKKFIQSCKAEYPASRYALILSNHGGGVKSFEPPAENFSKSICLDVTSSNDALFVAEITDVLTPAESVNLIAFDACIMGGIEIAYQYRPGRIPDGFSADAMTASPPNVWGDGFDYENILMRLNFSGGNNGEVDSINGGLELNYNPSAVSGIEMGKIIVEEQYDSTDGTPSQAMSCYDLTKVSAVKTAVDALAVQLDANNEKTNFEKIRGDTTTDAAIFYFDKARVADWINIPHFDLYDLASKVTILNGFTNANGLIDKAAAVQTAVDAFIVSSFAGADYSGFINGKSGVYIFFPDGDRTYLLKPMWNEQWWYNSKYFTSSTEGYGRLTWCEDGALENGSVENWFELLDIWYDNGDNINGYTP